MVFFSRGLSDELLFELRLAPACNVVIGSDETQLACELSDIQLELNSFTVKNSLMRSCLATKRERDSCTNTSLISRKPK